MAGQRVVATTEKVQSTTFLIKEKEIILIRDILANEVLSILQKTKKAPIKFDFQQKTGQLKDCQSFKGKACEMVLATFGLG